MNADEFYLNAGMIWTEGHEAQEDESSTQISQLLVRPRGGPLSVQGTIGLRVVGLPVDRGWAPLHQHLHPGGRGGGDNRFEIEQWHRQALRELGYADVSERAALLAHLRGYAEEFLEGRRDFLEVLQYFADLQRSENDELLVDLNSLLYCYWDFEYVDLSKEGINSLDDFPKACAAACADLIQTIQTEQEATGLPTREPVGPATSV